jgi:hypothetical protein
MAAIHAECIPIRGQFLEVGGVIFCEDYRLHWAGEPNLEAESGCLQCSDVLVYKFQAYGSGVGIA